MADLAAELTVALRTWSEVPCTSFRARHDGERSVTGGDDGVNAVILHAASWPTTLTRGAVAETVVTLDGAGAVRDADIHLNGVDHAFSLDGRAGTQDLRSVLVHEIGHALGLEHSRDERATMAAAGSGLRWRSLEVDDREGLCALYPANGTPAAPRCPTAPCPAGFVCVAAACQRPKDRGDVCSPCERTAFACEAAGDDARCIDIGVGEAAGRVCGRACANDADCGSGFACRASTEAGDFQCVSLDACRNGGSPCATDGDCTNAVCRSGACVGVVLGIDADAGAVSGADAGATSSLTDAPTATGGGCACSTSPAVPGTLSLVAATLAVAILQMRRRARMRPRRRTNASAHAASTAAPSSDEPCEPCEPREPRSDDA